MEWSLMFAIDNQPTGEQISSYVNNPLWHNLCSFIEERFGVVPKIEYSKCGMAPGWNVKYKKSSKSICTLYPAVNFFTCLVVVGSKEEQEAELVLTACDPYVQELYKNVKPFNGSRWLMVDVTSPKILEDVKELISLRVKPAIKKH